MNKSKSGFTIVELLIVIVVIGILAAITIVAYNGIQRRAQISTAQSELSKIDKAIRMSEADKSRYPTNAAEWTQILKDANMFDNTRDPAKKAFMVCYNATEYAIIASTPILKEANGEPHYFVSSKTGGIGTFNWNTATPGTYTIDRGCAQSPIIPTSLHWSNGL